jgi:hypothetical protein
VRWWFDRTYGLQGDGTFNIFLPSQAGYALANYPFDVKPVNPQEILPRAVLDCHHGYFAARNRWKDADDLLTVMHLKSTIRNYVHQATPAAALRIVGFDNMFGEIEKVYTRGATRILGGLGGKVTHFEAGPDGTAVIAADMRHAYMRDNPEGWPPLDAGIKAMRVLAVDYSGVSGSPGLYALADRIQGDQEKTWRLNTSLRLEAAGDSFMVTDKKGCSLEGRFISPKGVKLEQDKKGLSATGYGDFFVVMTLAKGKRPPINVEGQGINSKVMVGSQTVRFDGEKIVLGK